MSPLPFAVALLALPPLVQTAVCAFDAEWLPGLVVMGLGAAMMAVAWRARRTPPFGAS